MPTIDEKYDQQKLDSLKRYLQKEQAKGRAKDYEIIIDDFKIVSRTNDVSEFDDYEPEITDKTRKLSVLIYDGAKSNRNTNHTYYLQGEVPFNDKDRDRDRDSNTNNMGLGEIEKLIQEKLEAKDREYEFKRMKELLEEKTLLLEEAEVYTEKLENELDDLRKNKIKNLLKTTEVGSTLLQGMLGSMLKKIPGAEGLAGLLGAPVSDVPNVENEPETLASFERKSSPTPSKESWETDLVLLVSKFQEQERNEIITILEFLTQHPNRIDTINTLLIKH